METSDDVFTCEDGECHNIIDMRKNEDFYFEVPKEHSFGKEPGISVCESCWLHKEYARIYYLYQSSLHKN